MKTHIHKSISFLATLLVLLLSAFPFSNIKASRHVELPSEELSRLNSVISRAPLYEKRMEARLDSIKTLLRHARNTDAPRIWHLSEELAAAYLNVRVDSSLHYARKAYETAVASGQQQWQLESNIAIVNALSTAGVFTRAGNMLDGLEEEFPQFTLHEKMLYWGARKKYYAYLRVYIEGDGDLFREYSDNYFAYDDSLIKYAPRNDPMREFYLNERLIYRGRSSEAKRNLLKLLKGVGETENLYGMITYQLALVSRQQGDLTSFARYMALASISDIKCGVADGLALPALAEFLYSQGEMKLAFKYANFALETALEGNIKMRTINIASMLPLIDRAYNESLSRSRDELMVYLLVCIVLMIAGAVLVGMVIKQSRKRRQALAQLAKTSEMQGRYIGNFIALSSSYSNRLQSLQKLVARKLAAGQGEELLKMIKQGKINDAESSEEFYKIFDTAFLDIYPDFINGINELLKPEERIQIKEPGQLTPELRIYAFVRLGVDESTRIAQILDYSVSTVYAYRNKMRNRAVEREKFDENVIKIGRHDETNE